MKTFTAGERQSALELALKVRRHRAAAKADLKAGKLKLSDFVATEDEVLAGTKVADLFNELSKRTLVAVALGSFGLSEDKRLRGLGESQKSALYAVAKGVERRFDGIIDTSIATVSGCHWRMNRLSHPDLPAK